MSSPGLLTSSAHTDVVTHILIYRCTLETDRGRERKRLTVRKPKTTAIIFWRFRDDVELSGKITPKTWNSVVILDVSEVNAVEQNNAQMFFGFLGSNHAIWGCVKFLELHKRCCQNYCWILTDLTGLIHKVFIILLNSNHTRTHTVRTGMYTDWNSVASVSPSKGNMFPFKADDCDKEPSEHFTIWPDATSLSNSQSVTVFISVMVCIKIKMYNHEGLEWLCPGSGCTISSCILDQVCALNS